MKLDKHIAYRFLTDETMAWEIVETMHPTIRSVTEDELSKDNPTLIRASDTYQLVNIKGQKAYYITDTVIDKLSLLKVSKSKVMPVVVNDTREIVDNVATYDWSVFKDENRFKNGAKKYTFIFPGNEMLRLLVSNGYMSFCYFNCETFDIPKNHCDLRWVMFWVDINNNRVCLHWKHKDVQNVEERIFKLLCFMYLSNNEEQVVLPGHRYGTKKHGKLINSLNIPVTVVTSKWNVTSVRTEGFDVSGHFRLQPTSTGTKMIFIQPFKKYGYVRKAKSQED